MKTIALILIAFLSTSTNNCLKLDIILIGDMSSSVNGHQKFLTQAFDAFIKKYELAEDGLKIGIVTFNDNAKTICSLTTDKTKLIQSSDSLSSKYPFGSTYMAQGLNNALDEFAANGRYGYTKMIVVISDGSVNDPAICQLMAGSIKNLGIKICSVMIVDGSENPEFMENISNNCYLESSYESLHKELSKLNICM